MLNSIFYFRGINTAGDELLRFAGLKLGPMHQQWQKELCGEFNFVPVIGRGVGSFSEQIAYSSQFIDAYLKNKPPQSSVFFLAHSAGGLIARGVAHQMINNINLQGITYIAVPHQGSKLAEKILEIPKQRPYLNKFLAKCGYNILHKTRAFNEMSPANVSEFNKKFPHINNLKCTNIVSYTSAKNWSWPIRSTIHLAKYFNDSILSDGVVEYDSQRLGPNDIQFELDHLHQIGVNFYLNPMQRQKAKKQWDHLVSTVKASFAKAVESAE